MTTFDPTRWICAAALVALTAGTATAQPTETQRVEMRDGVGLATDIYLPPGAGPFPVVVARTPYNKADSQEIGNNLRGAGIATVVQDLRGRYASEGVDCIFRCDGDGVAQDGVDTLTWIEAQAWCDGHIMSWGGSALGIVQYMVAPAQPPGLRAMWVDVATPSFYDHTIFQGGCLRQALIEGWLEGQGSSFFLDDIAAHPLVDDFWRPVQTADRYGQVTVPAVHAGGWYDIFAQGTLDAFVGYQHLGGPGAAGAQKLIMGPWPHSLRNRAPGELVYPEDAARIPVGWDRLTGLWLTHYLGIQPDPGALEAIPAVQYYVMGDVDDPAAPGNTWRTAEDWPIPAAPIRLYLQPDGTLSEACPPDAADPSPYDYDPADPSPTVGGANLILPAGPFDQRAVEERDDVLVFSTPPLTAPLEITGRVRAHLWVSVDAVDTDVMVRLTDVYPDGRSMLILDGAYRLATRGTNDTLSLLAPDERVEAVVDLWSTSIILNAGHRLRAVISSSNAPRFLPNPNDGTSYRDPAAAPVAVTVSLHHDRAHLSYLELPDPQRAPAEVNRCEAAATPDAGPEPAAELAPDAGGVDAGSIDGGLAETHDAPCSCEDGGCAGAGGAPGPLAAVLILLLWALGRPGRRRSPTA